MRALAVLVLMLAGCQRADSPPQGTALPTIVSLNPCADAILAEVAAPGQLLAISHYSHDLQATSMPLEQALRYPATGGTVEEVLALGPDMVVADSFLPPAVRNGFGQLGVNVVTLGIASDVEASVAQVRQLARASGRSEQGEVLAARIIEAWDAAASSDKPIKTLFWQEGGIVPGPDSLIAQMLQHTGFASHSAAQRLGQGAYLPLEQVLADPPQLVLAASDERMLSHPVLRDISGMAFEIFDPGLLYCGGPSIPRALDRLVEIREQVR